MDRLDLLLRGSSKVSGNVLPPPPPPEASPEKVLRPTLRASLSTKSTGSDEASGLVRGMLMGGWA